MGHVQDTEDGRLLQLPDEEQKKEFHSILEWADETKSFVVFGEEDQTYGRFETDIFVEENAYFELSIFSARVVCIARMEQNRWISFENSNISTVELFNIASFMTGYG